ncbi:hypothetical protein D8B26_007908 [Coccidioides posadasii str. Silveira]|uniref:Rhodopsin domain-containing protein n=3 Tax=Coccidioides posadasii TaxID=199306 RepID=E9D1P5_COCPS|nr:hypothetical protein CPC735_018880 [Coccidioides posadasii C735 delta SOWgp]EER25284.1 hypothetical protein CPC735_018880 [Coccidioides posadasii C735 delta SOWgp]EFW19720.1 conserved hypothetical protein [Coccidioides posadasii str. Silveira]KMM72173.1 hypothetical protein CPAG_08470 [Coccidioides posadasii RMSCC 3488]QVM13296.1 hypothetical protein D8B26_007908 [Coccidioides posadasii str. Silveira]|eukprot:XP_003067429.1 hypothetical protein CPC735_018880 [Coccidioides posadasii C735 delta SOWgp]
MASTAGNDDANKGPMLLAVMWSLTIVTAIIVTARIYIRAKIVRNLGPDDWLIIAGMALGIVYVAITHVNVVVGYGRQQKTLAIENIETAIMLNTVSFIFGILSFTIPKLAVAAMLNRILNPTRFQRYFLWILTGLGTVISIVCILVLFTMCSPPQGLWRVRMKAKCRDTWILINYAIFTGAVSAFVDLYLSIYPTTVLWKLQMSTRKKVALSAALSLGSIASAMAIIKCTQLQGLADQSNYTYSTAELVVWTNIEANVVVIASCIPTLKPLIERLSGTIKGSRGSSGRYYGRYAKDSSGQIRSSSQRSKRFNSKKNSISITNAVSEESFLPTRETKQGIRRTDDVCVEYEMQDEFSREANIPSQHV